MDNTEFLRSVFASRELSEQVWICSFAIDPSNPTASWGGHIYTRTRPIPTQNNNFFCISTMRAVQGEVRRRIANYAGTYCIVLDDVGTKVGQERVSVPASWWLETSPGNYQVGYIVRPVLREAEEVLRLQLALIQQGLAVERDPGMANVTRYMRLPVGQNTKAKYGGWVHRLEDWRPKRCYSLEDLVAGYQLDLSQVAVGRLPEVPMLEAGQVDPYLLILQQLGLLYGRPKNNGTVHSMICPWVEEHTDKEASGTAYLSPCGFKCYHGHCQSRTFHDLKLWLGGLGQDISRCESILRNYKLETANRTLPLRKRHES